MEGVSVFNACWANEGKIFSSFYLKDVRANVKSSNTFQESIEGTFAIKFLLFSLIFHIFLSNLSFQLLALSGHHINCQKVPYTYFWFYGKFLPHLILIMIQFHVGIIYLQLAHYNCVMEKRDSSYFQIIFCNIRNVYFLWMCFEIPNRKWWIFDKLILFLESLIN